MSTLTNAITPVDRTGTAPEAAHGRVELAFARDGACTVLSRQHAVTPLHVQGVLGRRGPDDPCVEVAVLNVAGGMVAGDLLEQTITAGPGAAVRVLTVGATRLYRATGDAVARVRTTLRVDEDAHLEYLPDEIIPYAGALYESDTMLDLAPRGHAIVSEVVGPGRLHRGEVFAYRRLILRVRADRAGIPLLRDTLVLEPALWPPRAGPILGPYTHLATLYAFGLTHKEGAILAADLHALLEDSAIHGGATVGYEGTVVLRAVGHSAYTLLQTVRAAAALCRWKILCSHVTMARGTHMTIDEVNALDRAGFVAALGAVFEGPPWIVERAWEDRPFADVTRLHERLCAVMYGAPEDRRVALIRAHPDLVGRAALAGTLSPESTGEQSSAGLDRLSPQEIDRFTRLNQAYHDAFGFPFVICVRENKKEGILNGFDARLGNTREQEIATALGEVAKIARLRLQDRIGPAVARMQGG